MISKYWVCFTSLALGSLKVEAKLTPSNGSCGIPFTTRGGVIPITSYRVGTTSFTCKNCERGALSALILAGQRIANGLRVPPKCAAINLVDLYGELPAQPHAAWYMFSTLGPPKASSPPSVSNTLICCSVVVGMPFCANSSLIEPFCPSADEPLSPQM